MSPSFISHLLETKSYFFPCSQLLLVYENVNYSTTEVEGDCGGSPVSVLPLTSGEQLCGRVVGRLVAFTEQHPHCVTLALSTNSSITICFQHGIPWCWGPQSWLSLQSKCHQQVPGEAMSPLQRSHVAGIKLRTC